MDYPYDPHCHCAECRTETRLREDEEDYRQKEREKHRHYIQMTTPKQRRIINEIQRKEQEYENNKWRREEGG